MLDFNEESLFLLTTAQLVELFHIHWRAGARLRTKPKAVQYGVNMIRRTNRRTLNCLQNTDVFLIWTRVCIASWHLNIFEVLLENCRVLTIYASITLTRGSNLNWFGYERGSSERNPSHGSIVEVSYHRYKDKEWIWWYDLTIFFI